MSSPLAAAIKGAARELELAWVAEEEREAELTAAERLARDPFLLADEGHVWISSKPDEQLGLPARTIKLQLYPTQRELIESWVDVDHLGKSGKLRFKNLVVEKSRQMGETWAVAYVLLWALHFHSTNLFAHHTTAAELDDGGQRNTVRSLFGKVRYMDIRLGASRGLPDPSARKGVPGLGRPLVFRPGPSPPARIESPSTDAVCYGGEQSPDPGRGGTFAGVVVDEAAYVRWGEKVHASLSQACPGGKLYQSTVNGDSNVHARLADKPPASWGYLRHHWSRHAAYAAGLHIAATPPGEDDPGQPTAEMRAAAKECQLCEGTRQGLIWDPQEPLAHRYPGRLTSDWYERAVLEMTDEQVAQELDIDRGRALTGRVYSEFSDELHVIREGIPFEPTLPLELAWDYGNDVTAVVLLQNAPDSVRILGLVERGSVLKTTATADLVAEAVRREMLELGVDPILVSPYWTRQLRAIGDPAGDSGVIGVAWQQVEPYRRQGFNPQAPPKHLAGPGRRITASVNAVKGLLLGTPKPLRICGVRAEAMATRLRNNVWPTDASGNRRPGSSVPEDNLHNHSCRALAYWAVATFPPPLEFDPLEEFEPPDDGEKVVSPFAGMEPGMTL